MAAVQLGTLANADQPVARSAAGPGPGSVVDDLEVELVGRVADTYACRGGAGVLERVRQRLLHDPVRREVDARGELYRRSFAHDVDRETHPGHRLGEIRQRVQPGLRR